MKKGKLMLLLLLTTVTISAQKVGVKTNLLYWATTTPNIGLEYKVGEKSTFSLVGAYNPLQFPSKTDAEGITVNPKLKHWVVMPEFKYWFCKAFERTNIGIHGIYGKFNAGGISFIPKLKDYRYKGQFFGGGISAGYQWAMGNRMGLELSAGAGYLFFDYKKFECHQCGEEIGEGSKNYIGPTKVAISVIYYLK